MAEKNEYTGYYPKSGDELKFYLKHLIKLVKKSKPAENDKQFDGGTKVFDRKKDRHGYMPGEDRKVYESSHEEDPVKIKRMQGKDWHSKPAALKNTNNYDPKVIEKNVRALLKNPKKQKEISSGKVQEDKIEEGYIKPYVSHSGTTATVMNSKGENVASFNKKEHGEKYMDHANAHLKKNYDKYNTKNPTLHDLLNRPTIKRARNQHPNVQKEETMKSLSDILGESVHDVISEERQVTTAAVKAFMGHNKHNSRNTKVFQDGKHTVMTLHGNRIATHDHETGEIKGTTAGWPGPTTKGRLNGIAKAVGAGGFHTKNHQLHHDDKPTDPDAWVTLRKGS